jgi:hypothetical protein
VNLDRDDLARELGRLAARRGTEVEHPLSRARPDGEAGELGATALRPDEALFDQLGLKVLDDEGVGEVGIEPSGQASGHGPRRLTRTAVSAGSF